MATSSKGQRVAAFLLALMFLLTTIGTAVYVIITIRQGEGGIVNENTSTTAPATNNSTEAPVSSNPLVGQTISNFTGPVAVPSLRFDDSVVGDGAEVQTDDTVTIQYTGALASDGTIFDSSVGGDPATFPLANLIPGWQAGIPGMKVGGTRRLFIPASLGYGEAGSGSAIPPNSDLIFDIELINTQTSQ